MYFCKKKINKMYNLKQYSMRRNKSYVKLCIKGFVPHMLLLSFEKCFRKVVYAYEIKTLITKFCCRNLMKVSLFFID